MPERRALILAIAVLGALGTIVLANLWSLEYYGNVVDDALISMNYARRLASGDGLVFNPGERVEGYTNFLWTVAMAPMFWLANAFHGSFVHYAVELSIAVAALDVILTVLLARRLWGDAVVPIAFVVGLLVLDNSYTVWAMMALESHFVALFVLLALLFWTGRTRRRELYTGLCLACVPMARPDGAIFVAAFALSEAVNAALVRDKPRMRYRAKSLAIALGVAALVYGAYFVWRYRYYGWLLPNTFYLKLGSSHFAGIARGKDYWRTFLLERGGLPLMAVGALPWIKNSTIRTLTIWVAAHVLFIVYAGGDFYAGHRFFVQLLPAFALLSGAAVKGVLRLFDWQEVKTWLRRANAYLASHALLGVALIGCLGQQWLLGMKHGPLAQEIRIWRPMVDSQRRYMLWLSKRSHPDEYISAGDIGGAGLYANLRVIDYYGVIDAAIAHQDVPTLGRGKPGHEKTGNVEDVLRRRPKFIKWGYLPGIFWSRGYYFETRIPLDVGMPGIWVRDDLPAHARLVRGSEIHFDSQPLPGWSASGTAFEKWPIHAMSQRAAEGVEGWFVSSFHPRSGDHATGTLTSAPISLSGDRMVLRVGGGHDPERLRVDLVIDDQVVFSETGTKSESMGRREWDIAPYRGRTAILEIVDESAENGGHIMLDEIAQYSLL